jgi:hypothetical protein
MTLFEIGLSKAPLPNIAHPSDFHRLEILYACLESVGNFFENFLAIPSASYWNFSVVQFSHLGYAIAMLQRLSIFEDPTWNLHYVAEKVNFLDIVDKIRIRMEQAVIYGETNPSSVSEITSACVFARAAAKMKKLKAMFEAWMPSTQSAPDQMSNFDTGYTNNLENMVGFWEQDWFDFMGGNSGGL